MENNIIALLNKNLRVIIPDFGAFIIRQKQPRIIVFNEFLRYNDGLLIDFIIKTEGIDREVAEQQVAAFAEDSSKLLTSGKELVIEGLGTLKKTGGKIVFTEAGQPPAADNESLPYTGQLFSVDSAPEPDSVPLTEPVNYDFPRQPLIPPPASQQEYERPSRSFRITAWILLILIINVGVLALFVFKGRKERIPETRIPAALVSDSVYDRLADSMMAAVKDTTMIYSEVPLEKPEINTAARSPSSRYYIVAGCFNDEFNADSLVSSLKKQGFKAEKFGRIGNLYAVSYASFNSKDQALPQLRKIREKIPSAWMTKF